MKLMSYRVTFRHDVDCNYFEGYAEKGIKFSEVHTTNWPVLEEIYEMARIMRIDKVWHFYEPYVELNWMAYSDQNKNFVRQLKRIFKEHKIKDAKFDGGDPLKFRLDWYCKNDKEMLFGCDRHAVSSQMVRLIEKNREAIEAGMGINYQVSRCIHTIANPLGLNYKEEYKICFTRGLMCFLYWYFPPKVARFLYVKVFRQRLPM